MFPNVRLLAGALFASLVALSCGFGVFAAFRVNHDPLNRLPGPAAALQLVADEPAQPHPNWGVPVHAGSGAVPPVAALIDVTMPVRQVAAEPADAAAARPAKIEGAAAKPEPKASPPTQLPVSAARLAPAAPASAPAAMPVPAAAAPAPAAAATQQIPAVGAQNVSSAPAVQRDAVASTATVTAASADTASDDTASAEAAAKKTEPAQPALSPATTQEPSLAPAQNSAAAAASAEITGSIAETAATGAPPIPAVRPKLRKRITRKPVERRHVVLRRRLTHDARTRPASRWSAQSSTYSEPVFQSAPNFQQSAAQSRGGRSTQPSAPAESPAWTRPQ